MTSQHHRHRAVVAGAALAAVLSPLALAQPAAASGTANEVVQALDANGDGVYTLVLRDLERGTTVEVLGNDTTRRWLYEDPELSPDGQRIALSTDRGAPRYDERIAVVRRDGTGLAPLYAGPPQSPTSFSTDLAPSWSPDGTTLLFTRVTQDLSSVPARVTSALWTVPAAGGTPTQVPGSDGAWTGDWHPTDSTRVVFAALPPQVDPDGTGPLPLGEPADSGPVTVMRTDGTGRRALADAVGAMPSWSPDGGTVAYAEVTERDPDRVRRHDVAQVAVVAADGRSPRRVLAPTRPSSARTVAEHPAWTPDGSAVVFDLFAWGGAAAYPPGDLWAVDPAGVRAGRVAQTAADEVQPHLQGPAPAPVVAGAASTFTPVPPARVLDTRSGLGAPAAPVGPGGTVVLQATGSVPVGGGGTVTVPANASAVVLNVTATGATAATDVRVYPADAARVPHTSSLNTGPGRAAVPNLVTVAVSRALGTMGRVVLRNTAGSVHLVADLAGWYAPDATGTGYRALEPSRVLDTRPGADNVGAPAGRLGPRESLDLTVVGQGGPVPVPADATAVVLNVTAVGATATTWVRAHPTGTTPRLVSNLNLAAGETTANLVTVAVGRGGAVTLTNDAGEVDLVADLAGYYGPDAPSRFVPVAPSRFLDTRTGVGGAPIPTTAAGWVDLRVGGVRGVPAGATAAVVNLTGTATSTTTNVRAYPPSSTVPRVSNLNLTRGATRANLAVVRLGADGRLRVRNEAGTVHLVGDLAGYMVG